MRTLTELVGITESFLELGTSEGNSNLSRLSKIFNTSLKMIEDKNNIKLKLKHKSKVLTGYANLAQRLYREGKLI